MTDETATDSIQYRIIASPPTRTNARVELRCPGEKVAYWLDSRTRNGWTDVTVERRTRRTTVGQWTACDAEDSDG